MPNRTIGSLALLKVSWDQQQKDYFENFVPMVAECIRLSEDEVVSVPVLQTDLQSRFGLTLPQSAIDKILRRVRKRGYVRLKNRVYTRNLDALNSLPFREVQQQVMQVQEQFISSFVSFCSDRYEVALSTEDAETAIQSFLEQDQLIVADAMANGTVIPAVKRPVKHGRFLVATFVRHLQELHGADLGYFETIVKGHMLANAVFLPDPSRASRNFQGTEVFLDTPFLILALGYGGQARKEPRTELLNLLYETGAKLRCFRHTSDEIKGILDSSAARMGSGNLHQTFGSYGQSIDHFLSQGYSSSDVSMLATRLDKDLGSLGVQIVDRPEYRAEHVIDEDQLQAELTEQLGYYSKQAVRRDVESVAAIVRLRRGRECFFVEECRAIFITNNWSLVRVVNQALREGTTYGAMHPCLTDYTLTNLLWLKKPTASPDLPRKRIIADCYAATQPSDKLWRAYLSEIQKLEAQGDITEEDYYLLRYDLEAKTALMDLTRGDEGAFTQGTVQDILSVIRSDIQSEAQQELEAETRAREEAERLRQEADMREANRKFRIGTRAQTFARKVCRVLKYVVLGFLVLVTLLTSIWGVPSFFPAWSRYPIAVASGAILVFSAISLMFGTKLETYIDRFESLLTRGTERMLLKLSE